jgi:crossover junction endodeoxyribonuclease RuvC
MRILGIDPGSRFLGFAIVDLAQSFKVVEIGVYKFNLKKDFNQRLAEVGEGMQELLRSYKPDQVSLEKIFLGKNADSAFKLGHARGLVIYHCVQNKIPVFEYATRAVKKGITGRGSSEKEQVRATLEAYLKIGKIKSLDASDALALAVYHGLHRRSSIKVNQVLQRSNQKKSEAEL